MAKEITIRLTTAQDEAALARLAALDAKPEPAAGQSLLALVDGEPQAAMPLSGGPALADPFRHTAELVQLLRARAEQLAGDAAPGRRAGLLRHRRPRALARA